MQVTKNGLRNLVNHGLHVWERDERTKQYARGLTIGLVMNVTNMSRTDAVQLVDATIEARKPPTDKVGEVIDRILSPKEDARTPKPMRASDLPFPGVRLW